jgi:hypothetical protein
MDYVSHGWCVNSFSGIRSHVFRSTAKRLAHMTVSLIRKLWKEKVTVPRLLKQTDKILDKIDVKLKKRSQYERND